MEDEILREIHEIREKIVREHGHDSDNLDDFFESLRFPGFKYGIPGRTFHTEGELDEYIDERNREFESRKARGVSLDGMRPPEQRQSADTDSDT